MFDRWIHGRMTRLAPFIIVALVACSTVGSTIEPGRVPNLL